MTQLSRLCPCLTACVPLRLAAQSELVQVAMHFLNFEARHLFGSVSQLQLGIVDRFFDLPPEKAKVVVTPMETSLKQSDELAKFMRFCQQITHTNTNAHDLKVSLLKTGL
jgi:homospermidine synthase